GAQRDCFRPQDDLVRSGGNGRTRAGEWEPVLDSSSVRPGSLSSAGRRACQRGTKRRRRLLRRRRGVALTIRTQVVVELILIRAAQRAGCGGDMFVISNVFVIN